MMKTFDTKDNLSAQDDHQKNNEEKLMKRLHQTITKLFNKV